MNVHTNVTFDDQLPPIQTKKEKSNIFRKIYAYAADTAIAEKIKSF